jgi:hypothetical protein
MPGHQGDFGLWILDSGPAGQVEGLVDWWIGGLVDWWIGGLVDWWIARRGIVADAASLRRGKPVAMHAENTATRSGGKAASIDGLSPRIQ